MPFWSRNDDYKDEAGTFYVPAGPFLPKLPRPGDNEGAKWADYRYTGTNFGAASIGAAGKEHGRAPGRLPVDQ